MPPQLSVADVRLALHALRYSWYEDMTPDTPFLFSATALAESSAAAAGGPTSSAGTHLSMAEFGCVFDYAQHIKRHQRLVPKRDAGTGAGTGTGTAPQRTAYAKPDQVLAEIKRKEELRERQEAEAAARSALRASASAGSGSASGSAL